MRYESIDIRGFGRLEREIELAAGLNVVTGPNEAGKSTLRELLIRTLTGYDRGERTRFDGVSLKDHLAPWHGESHGANARIVLGDGTALVLEWDFAEHRLRIAERETGADRTQELGGGVGDVEVSRRLFDLSPADLRRIASIEQVTLEAVGHEDGLPSALRDAVEGVGERGGSGQAIDILNAVLLEQLGVRRPRDGRELGEEEMSAQRGRRLASRRSERERLVAEWEETQAEREAVSNLASRVEEERRRSAQAVARRDRLEGAALVAERESLVGVLERAREAERLAEGAELDRDLEDEARALERRRRELQERAEELRQQVGGASEIVAELERERARLTDEVTQLEGFREVDQGAAERVRDLKNERERLARDVTADGGDEASRREELESARRRIAERSGAGGGAGQGSRALWASAAIIVAAASVGLAVVVSPLALAGLALSLLLAFLAARQSSPAGADASLQQELERLGVEDRTGLDRAIWELENLSEARRRAGERVEEVDRELARLLESVGYETEEVEAGVRAYLHACEQRARRGQLVDELRGVEQRLEQAGGPRTELTRVETELGDVESRLLAAYGRAGIEPDGLEEAAIAFDELAGRARAAREATSRAQGALGDRDVEAVEADIAELDAKIAEHERLHGPPGDVWEEEEIDSELARARSEAAEAELELTRLESELEQREGALPDAAELAERLEDIDAEIERIEETAHAVWIARETIREAGSEIHRRFAPQLNEALSRRLSEITAGRYSEVAIDDELEVRVFAPETGRQVKATRLSRGTQDQIYAIQRLEIAGLLARRAGSEVPPLLFEDPFIRHDSERARLMCALLGEHAQSRQVVVFSHDPGVTAALRSAGCEPHEIRLEGPASS